MNGVICFFYEVCKDNKLSSCITEGDFNLNTNTVSLAKHERATISISRYELCARDKCRLAQRRKERKRGRGFTPYKDTFIVVSVILPSGERPMKGDITVSLERPLEPKNKSSDNKLMDHVTVGGVLKLLWPHKKPYIEQDRCKLDSILSLALSSRRLLTYQSCNYAQIIEKVHVRLSQSPLPNSILFYASSSSSSRIRKRKKHRHTRTFQ